MAHEDKYVDLRVKHLEMIQAVTSRMSGYSATLKNYSITIVTGIIGIAFTVKMPGLIALSAVVAIAFAYLDARYLQLERAYRSLFDEVRLQDWDARPLFDLRPREVHRHPYAHALLSWSVAGFYGPLVVVVAVVYAIGRGCI